MAVMVPASSLFVSEPPPHLFGNAGNEKKATWTNGNWLKSRFHFSFAEYRDSKRSSFGVLRVMNDDLVQPARGFGTHPHRNMEIVTYIVSGQLTHKDSMGTEETLGRGSVQFMTAGTGVRHSEFNHDPEKPLRFVQMWLMPNRSGLKPNYGGREPAAPTERDGRWAHLAMPVSSKCSPDKPVPINCDANIYAAEIKPGAALEFQLEAGRQAYVLCVEGSATAGGLGAGKLGRHDAMQVVGPGVISFSDAKPVGSTEIRDPEPGCHLLVVEMSQR
mmetsp:Transcript_31947/g.77920  ORF Transcript_31947/g.77920 Transcript_31947/m.77920 type:complete len:274 (-) Transcript_31947:15-836(-)